jgi:hypothetical protein
MYVGVRKQVEAEVVRGNRDNGRAICFSSPIRSAICGGGHMAIQHTRFQVHPRPTPATQEEEEEGEEEVEDFNGYNSLFARQHC